MAEIGPNGVRQIYANNGNFVTSFNDRGDRNDFSNPPINMEATGYFSGTNDDIAPKLRGGRHSDSASCDGCCYIPAFRGSGGIHYRVECPHPSYHDCSGSGSGSQAFSGMHGAKAIVWNTSNNCVHLELWQDSTGSAPGNWTRVFTDDDCSGKCGMGCGGGPLLRPRGSSSQFTWRNDGSPQKQWLHLVEITPGGAANPGTGTPGTGGNQMPGGTGSPAPGSNTGGGDGGGGSGNDNSTGTVSAFAGKGCAIAQAGNVIAQAGTCGGTSGSSGSGPLFSPGSGAGVGAATEPEPIITVYKDLPLLWNVRTDLFDNCTVTGDPNITDYTEVYNVNPDSGEYIPLFKNGIQFVGTKLHGSKSVLTDKVIRKVVVTMKKSTSVALTGDIKISIRDRNGKIMTEFDTEIDAATIDLNDTSYTFLHNENNYKLQTGDMILLNYDEGDSTNHILVADSLLSDTFDGFNTVHVESQSGISYDVDQLADFAAQISI